MRQTQARCRKWLFFWFVFALLILYRVGNHSFNTLLSGPVDPLGSVDADLGQDLGVRLDLGGVRLLLLGRLGASEWGGVRRAGGVVWRGVRGTLGLVLHVLELLLVEVVLVVHALLVVQVLLL